MIVRQIALRQSRRALRLRQLHTSQRKNDGNVDGLEALTNNAVDETAVLTGMVNNVAPGQMMMHPALQNRQLQRDADQQAEEFKTFKRQKKATKHHGVIIREQYNPRDLLEHPPKPDDISLELLLASQAHMGHATLLWNPANARYIEGIREGVHIISLEATAAHLRRAAKVIEAVTRRAGIILFVGTRAGQDQAVVRAAELAGGCHLFERWIPGSITNSAQILGRCKLQVVNEFDQPVAGYEDELRELPPLKPDLVVCLNPLENWVMLHECALHNIPTIGVIDTDANPTWVTYPIPANDDSIRCIQMIAGVLGQAGAAGRQARLEVANNKRIPVGKRLQWQDAEYVINMRKEPDETGGSKSAILEALRVEKDRITINCGPDPDSIDSLEQNIHAQRDRLRKAAGLPPLSDEDMGAPIEVIEESDAESEDYDRFGRSRQKN